MTNDIMLDSIFEEELDPRIIPPPLADPVFTAIFQNAEVGGLAMKSLINATLADSGDILVSDIYSVTPQSVHSETSDRSYRVDVEAKAVSGEIALIEVQLSTFASTIERTLLYSEQAFASGANRGETLAAVTSAMPRVIAVNIMDFELRAKGLGLHQVAEVAYREAPYEKATDKLEIHNLELPKFQRLAQPDLTKPLHCWLAAICRSQQKKISLREVIDMDAALKEFYQSDPGFAQFAERYGVVTATPEIRKAYRRWEYDRMLNALEEERKTAKQEASLAKSKAEGIAEGKAEGIAEGEARGIVQAKQELYLDIALRTMKQKGNKTSQTMLDGELMTLGVPDNIIKEAHRIYEAEKAGLRSREKTRNKSEHDL